MREPKERPQDKGAVSFRNIKYFISDGNHPGAIRVSNFHRADKSIRFGKSFTWTEKVKVDIDVGYFFNFSFSFSCLFSDTIRSIYILKRRKRMPETVIQCPKCNRDSFYFNNLKKLGICFRASCAYKAGPREVAKLLGAGPRYSDSIDRAAQGILGVPTAPLELPGTALVEIVSGEYVTNHPVAVQKVIDRGVSFEDQYRFGLTVDQDRVYIPVHYEGKLLSYVGRAIWWHESPEKLRYKYPKGVKVTNYLFNWDEAKSYPYLTIVENTFNAIRYRKLVNSTSCFGSALSSEQVKLIARASCKLVILLWDEGAEVKAEGACRSLQDEGIRASCVFIKGQPDNHSDPEIQSLVFEKISKEGYDNL